MAKRYELYVEYKGGQDPSVDRQITKIVGHESESSGQIMFGDRERDLEFYFTNRKDASKVVEQLNGKVINGRAITARLEGSAASILARLAGGSE